MEAPSPVHGFVWEQCFMQPMTHDTAMERLQLADQLQTGRSTMFDPQDLPGRYGRVIRALDHLLHATGTEAVLGGGWAVWFHGYAGRLTQDVDIALPAAKVDEFVRAAAVAGFDVLIQPAGRWLKLRHRETQIEVDIMPEGSRPGTAARPAPTVIPNPRQLGALPGPLRYMKLESLIELKLAAGRTRDESDIIELIRANPDQVAGIRQHLAQVHLDYQQGFDHLLQRAQSEEQPP
jgi:hypothetical protein